jgi:hypothetical protein
MKNLIDHYEARIRHIESELLNKVMPVSYKIKREAQKGCYETFVKELQKLLSK